MTADPVWMLRINPLRRCRLADPGLAALLDEVASRSHAAPPLAETACDDLYRLVPATTEPLRGALLALRRDIHNGRGDADRGEQLPIELPASVLRWSDNQRRLRACQQQVRQRHAAAVAAERSHLRSMLGDDDFLITLAQSAPGVYDAARRYRGRLQPDSKDRKAERALLQYLTRAMVRTSPYGRFTAVGLATPDPAGVSMAAVTADGARPVAGVDRALFDYVAGGLLPPGDDPLLVVPPSARISDGKLTFFQVGPDALRRLSAPMTGHTKVLVDLLDVGARRRSALATALAERSELELAAADDLIGKAIQLGLLVTVWRGDEFVAEPVEQALQDLSAIGADRVPGGLRQLRAGLGRLSDRANLDTAETRIAAIGDVERLGQDLGRLARRPARLSVDEDLMLPPFEVDPSQYQPALDDLAVVAELASAFDRVHVARALVTAALVARFGPGCRVNLVDHAAWLVGAVYHGERLLAESPDALTGPNDGSLRQLAKLRAEVVGALADELTAGDAELAWSCDRVAEMVSGLPERFRRDPASYGMVVQPDGEQLVLNDAYAGHGPMLSRFLYADGLVGGDATARLGERLAHLYGGVRLVEDRGCHGVGINVHPPILADALDPAAWSRLELAHDADTDSVAIVDGDGAPVRVLSLGAQLPELFPSPVRLAGWLSSSGRVVLDLIDKAHGQLCPSRKAPPGKGPTVAYPRLRVGRVTLSRQRWYPGSDFPAAPESPDEAGYLLALTAWRARHLVPAEVVLKSIFDGPVLWESLSEAGPRERFFELRSRSKPQYVDLASVVMARVLPRLLERRPAGIIEEARPALAGGGQAAEWMIELARPAGGTRFAWKPA